MKKVCGFISRYNNITTWIVAFLLCVVTYVLNKHYLIRATAPTCILDGVRVGMYMTNVIIGFIIISFWHMHTAKDDFTSLIAVRYHSRIIIWLKQCKRIAISCILFSLYLEAIGIINGIQYSSVILNWSKSDSYFSIVTDMTSAVISWQVLIGSFINLWLAMIIVMIFLIGSNWIFNTYSWGMCIIVATSFIDGWTNLKPIFLKRFIINSIDWCNPENAVKKIGCQVMIAIIIVIAGCLISRRKEFIGNNAERK